MRQQANNGTVRIISGKHRGRKLQFPAVNNVRPTPDRVRETLFNWLNPILSTQTRCLDVFAGSGILGLEALSRGAAWVSFWDQEIQLVKAIEQHLSTLGLNNQAKVLHMADSIQALSKPNQSKPFDVIFLDPPFKRNQVSNCLQYLTQTNHNWLADKAVIYLEAETDFNLEPLLTLTNDLQLLKSKKAGQVAYYLLRYHCK